MSRGIGRLQRRLLAMIEQHDPPMARARQLVAAILVADHGDDLQAHAKHGRALDRSVRRALRLLEQRNLVVEVEQRPVAYATPAWAAEMVEAGAPFGAPNMREGAHAMPGSDGSPADGSSPTWNLFDPGCWAREREAPHTDGAPLGLGEASATRAGIELLSLALQFPKELMRYAMDQLGLHKSAELLVEKHGRRKALAAVKGKPGRRRLTKKQIQHRLLADLALRLHGGDDCKTAPKRAEILAKAYDGTPGGMYKMLSEARTQSKERGIHEVSIAEEDQWLLLKFAKQVLDAASTGSKRQRSLLPAWR